jgi:hypothetical protein
VSEDVLFQPGDEETGLEPLGKYRAARGIDTTMRSVFDVLYEADEPLDRDTIAERTFSRASGAAQGHARRVMLRTRESHRKTQAKRRGAVTRERASFASHLSLEDAWRSWIQRLLLDSKRWGRLIRDEEGRYRPNPEKPPRAARADGTTFPYTREAWEESTARDRAVGEVQTMRMETNRLADLSREELQHAITLAVRTFEKQTGGRPPRSNNASRALRVRIGWLLDRPTTDAGPAWLLNELVRRAYGLPPEMF